MGAAIESTSESGKTRIICSYGAGPVMCVCVRVAEICNHFYFCWTRCHPHCAALHGAGEGGT